MEHACLHFTYISIPLDRKECVTSLTIAFSCLVLVRFREVELLKFGFHGQFDFLIMPYSYGEVWVFGARVPQIHCGCDCWVYPENQGPILFGYDHF